jgi:putative hydrolase of the HAD superfamily
VTNYRAVIFDLGGVVMGSPMPAIAGYERELGLAAGSLNRLIGATGPEGAWGRLERGKLSLDEFYAAFEGDCATAGYAGVSARELMRRMGEGLGARPQMLEALRRIRVAGLRTAALTNNWKRADSGGRDGHDLRAHFDAFIESSVVGLQKPDRRIYELVCLELGIAARDAIFLDDVGRNLKSARALGMATIRVEQPDVALRELSELLGFRVID